VQKSSSRAKVYRGANGDYSFRELAYARKNDLLRRLCGALADSGLVWGWGFDEGRPFNQYVLYVDLPFGQVSFHSCERMAGPDYPGQWDGKRVSEARVNAYCAHLLGEVTKQRPTPAPCDLPPRPNVPPFRKPQPRTKPKPPPTWRCDNGRFGIRVEYLGEAVRVTLTAKLVFGLAQCFVRNREFVALATGTTVGDSLYLSGTTFTTLGYGDVTPPAQAPAYWLWPSPWWDSASWPSSSATCPCFTRRSRTAG
jgi:hypothetical protein